MRGPTRAEQNAPSRQHAPHGAAFPRLEQCSHSRPGGCGGVCVHDSPRAGAPACSPSGHLPCSRAGHPRQQPILPIRTGPPPPPLPGTTPASQPRQVLNWWALAPLGVTASHVSTKEAARLTTTLGYCLSSCILIYAAVAHLTRKGPPSRALCLHHSPITENGWS